MVVDSYIQGYVSMRIAIPEWNNDVSTVFDTAGSIVIIDSEGPDIIRRSIAHVAASDILRKIIDLVDIRTDLVICGALSREMLELLQMHGITVVSGVHGIIEDIIAAYFDGTLNDGSHYMTGVAERRTTGQ